jgi:hypothetical protein
VTKHVSPTDRLDVVKADPTDNKILECAVAAGSEVIVSGDRHLLGLGEFRSNPIMTVATCLVRCQARG